MAGYSPAFAFRTLLAGSAAVLAAFAGAALTVTAGLAAVRRAGLGAEALGAAAAAISRTGWTAFAGVSTTLPGATIFLVR